MGRLVAYMANRTDRLEAVLAFEQHALHQCARDKFEIGTAKRWLQVRDRGAAA